MDRRKAIQIMGYSVASATLLGWGTACRESAATEVWRPDFHTEAEGDFLAQLGEAFLPATDIPGARAVGAHRFVDRFVDQVFDSSAQREWRVGLHRLQENWRENLQHDAVALLRQMLDLPEDEQREIKQLMEQTPPPGSSAEDRHYAYRTLFKCKELIMLGYFASKPIGEDVLAFLPTPGGYDPCIPYEEVGKAWSL
ncbi:gluconate 2-dehydrogenase subunit 3 family protein [Lewinella sp. W8]|uniref:gluconate 2-dehydrogenase subunit 3 family protein n=1 Tax=Lewinella sp. W8 TaxID=2528208 RepID=UPI0015644DD9|nr:gluconate 2-dehydrogenase subunit 3 family protein [Lewinella sp. W8]